ncbi:MAG: hypothetical protein WC551_05650 [Patescibacteria group bacterium]
MGNTEKTPDKASRAADKPTEAPKKKNEVVDFIYKFGFYVLLATTIFSAVLLNRTLNSSERLNDSCGKLQASSEKLLSQNASCITQRDSCLYNLQKIDQTAEKLQGLLDGCIAEMKDSTDTTRETIHSLQSLTACEQQLTHVTKQYRLETAKLVSDIEWCVEEKGKLQQQLLRPCLGM